MHWRTVLSSVQWGTFLVMLLCTLVPYLIYHAMSEPHERAFLIYDADISHPMFPNTVKGWMAPLFGFLLLFVTVSSTSVSGLCSLYACYNAIQVLVFITCNGAVPWCRSLTVPCWQQVAFGEFVLTRHLHASLTSQLSAFFYLVIDSVLSYWVTLLFTQVRPMDPGHALSYRSGAA